MVKSRKASTKKSRKGAGSRKPKSLSKRRKSSKGSRKRVKIPARLKKQCLQRSVRLTTGKKSRKHKS